MAEAIGALEFDAYRAWDARETGDTEDYARTVPTIRPNINGVSNKPDRIGIVGPVAEHGPVDRLPSHPRSRGGRVDGDGVGDHR